MAALKHAPHIRVFISSHDTHSLAGLRWLPWTLAARIKRLERDDVSV